MTGAPLIALRDFNVADAQRTTLLEVNLEVTRPGVIAVIGPAGAGKSLLLRALAGRLPRGLSTSGTRHVGGQDGRVLLELPLAGDPILPRGTLFKALVHPSLQPEEAERRVEERLRAVGLWDQLQGKLMQPFRSLSPVERLIVLSCRRWIAGEPFLLLDDPGATLDPNDHAAFERAVLSISEHIPVFWATRALRRVAPCAYRIIILRGAKVVADDHSDRIVVSPPPEAEAILEESAGHIEAYGIEDLYHELLELGSRAERAVHQAVQALTDQNLSVAREVIERDAKIDQLEQHVQESALGLIARAAPVGKDLRTLQTVIRAAVDLERIADHAVNISEVTLAIGDEPLIKPLIDIPRMAEKALAMVRISLDAMVRRDVALAETVFEYDQPVDELYRELFEELLGFVTDGGDAYRAGQALYLLFVARYLERVADHATNIAERVIFMVSGKRTRRHVPHENDPLPHPFLPR